jgi:hypothetical protein
MPHRREEVADSPPLETIARKFGFNADMLALSMRDPHPRMNITVTRGEAEDLASYAVTRGKWLPATLSSTLRNRPVIQMPAMRLPAPNSRCSRRRAHTAASASAHRADAEAASRAYPSGPILVRLDARVAWRGSRQHSGRQSRGSSGSRALSVRRGGA